MNKKSVVIVMKNIPYPPHTGGDVRVFNLLKRVAQRFDVWLICMSEEKLIPNAEHLKSYCKGVVITPIVTSRTKKQKIFLLLDFRQWIRIGVRIWLMLQGVPYCNACFYHPRFVAQLKELLSRQRFDIVQFEFFVTGQYLSDVRHQLGDTKTILVQHGILSEELRRMIPRVPWMSKVFCALELFLNTRYEKKMLRQFDHVVAMSQVDKDIMISWGLPEKKVTIIKNGVDVDEFKDVDRPELDNHLVFMGTMRYLPNYDGLGWFMDSIFPLIRSQVDNVSLVVIGEKDPFVCQRYSSQGVKFCGVVERLDEEMGKGAIFISPLRIGTGTRLKIVTAMAFGMPVVSTSIGIEGIPAGEDKGSIVANNERTFADAVISLLKDGGKRKRIGKNARAYVEKEYSWNVIAEELCLTYERLLT